ASWGSSPRPISSVGSWATMPAAPTSRRSWCRTHEDPGGSPRPRAPPRCGPAGEHPRRGRACRAAAPSVQRAGDLQRRERHEEWARSDGGQEVLRRRSPAMTRMAVMKVTGRRRSTGAVGLEGAPAGMGGGAGLIGSNGRFPFWNAAAERILGRTSREVLGRPCCDVFVGYDDNGNMLCTPGCQIMSLVRRGEPVHSFDMRTRTKAGRPVWINVSVLSTKDAQGPLIVHLFRDVTAAKDVGS